MAESLSAFIGVTAPELPKYIVANNFLACFFPECKLDKIDYNILQQHFICEEVSEDTRQKLFSSFNEYVDEYAGYRTLWKNSTTNYYFPVTEKMVCGYKSNLRNLLYNLLLTADGFDKDIFKETLRDFLWNKNNAGCSKMLNTVLSKYDPYIDKKKKLDINVEEFGEQRKKKYFKKLGDKLKEDLELMFDSEYFNELDFYKKYDYLSTLLTSYVVFFTAYRGNKGKMPTILCKGSTHTVLNTGDFHRACVTVHGKIREGYTRLLEDYYLNLFDDGAKKSDKLSLYLKDDLLVKVKINGEDKKFSDFINDDLFDWSKNGTEKKKNKIKKLIEYFDIKKELSSPITKQDFVIKYASFHKTQHGSNIIKISSVFSSSGGAIDFIFPKTSGKFKYFALSSTLAEYFVRLYLSEKKVKKGVDIGYLNDFTEWLGNKYGIYFTNNEKLEPFLKEANITVRTSEFNMNRTALIENLTSINCLIKVSDSTYIVILPEEKGEFKSL